MEHNKNINLHGQPSTVAIMEYIRDNGFPDTDYAHFVFVDCPTKFMGIFDSHYTIVVTDETNYVLNKGVLLDVHPLDTWHDVLGMKRYAVSERSWYAYINGRYYYLD